jgi:hypothetical protein
MSSQKAQRKLEVLNHLKKYGNPDEVLIVLSLHEFFEYADEGDIGCNLDCGHAHQLIYEQLKAIEKRDDVKEIWVCLTDTNGGNAPEFAEDWFFSDEVYIIGSISIDELAANWHENSMPDAIEHGWMEGIPVNLPHHIDESEVVTLWWD